jgi:hypothetical protein
MISKGLLRSQRQLAKTVTVQGAQIPAYKTTVDWSATQTETGDFTSRTIYDAQSPYSIHCAV